MEINNASMIAEMQQLAVESQPGALQPTVNTSQADFESLLGNAIDHVNGLQKQSSSLATRLELGDSSVTLSETMIAKEKAGVAFEATVQVRNKLVEAYKEIMSMPV
ncbi:flagellar hook-basal body complex protein FliE [Ferrimonas aestuarii]|uniref:Flagellar hook-basal body complex protein FliE n=1 Tax=Ferrimonas aestuarii TaxID=2569539 RepID=A0A4U1BSU4_9GAMM|nr:flagellar hook-basal body complex protein FliE [Ferrimonas aestuarii]TKB58232.1 flagellar hook-basal body complex protein FliE [Ferrimonas aestuarii]